MNRPPRMPTSALKVPVKNPTMRPRVKRPEKADAELGAGDPFALFVEWSGDADEKTYATL